MNQLEAMRMLVRVVDAGSFIAVANQLHIARSAVTRQIAALERHLGTQLLVRSTRRLNVTAAGAAYVEQCRDILSRIDAAESGLSEGRKAARGRIRLGLPLSFGLNVLMPALLDFAQQQPEVDLVMDLSDQRVNLIEDGLDLSVRVTAGFQPGDIVRKLGTCRMHTVASPAYLAQHGSPQHPDDLRQHPCLIYANDVSQVQWLYHVDQQAISVPVRGRVVANNGSVLTEAAVRGMGLAHQPDFLVQAALDQGLLRTVLAAFEGPPLGVYAVLPSQRHVPHRVRVLMDELTAHLSKPAGV